ncbi:MAG: uroporphyrinogen-III C-methyltransferase [Planctomycetota bacterium]
MGPPEKPEGEPPQPTPPTVYLIGAGPGDPGLLTLRGRECLARADVVLHDYLAGERLLNLARPDARLYCLGRHGAGKLWSQQEINERMVAEARAGACVARLKGGDPGVFGRLAEEVEALSAANLAFEVVPGVTTAAAAGAYAGVTITNREQASCVAFVTGHEEPNKPDSSLDYATLARFPGTLVIYMGVTTAAHWSGELIRHGKPVATPVVLVRRCSLPDQTTIDCTLGQVPAVLAPGLVRPPLVAIIGEVARRSELSSWFTRRPLFGKTVLVTRPQRQAGPMVQRLRDLGADVLLQPVIEVLPPTDWSVVDAAIDRLSEFDWVVFSSRNGVQALMDRVAERGFDARRFGSARLAAIGPATAAALGDYGLSADLHPEEYRAEALAEVLAAGASGKRVLLLRASRGREVLAEQLAAAGAEVEQVVVYRSVDVKAPDAQVAGALAAGRVDWTTATSSAIARSLVSLFGEDLRKTKLAAISPLTAGAMNECGHAAAAVAREYTAEGVVAAILRATE